MKLCFPVKEAVGFESEVYGHFGSTPSFVVVDTETLSLKTIANPDSQHAKGMCSPLRALTGLVIDGVVVGGIGGGALRKLNNAGIAVYKATARTLRENLELFNKGQLPEFAQEGICKGHSQGCAHR